MKRELERFRRTKSPNKRKPVTQKYTMSFVHQNILRGYDPSTGSFSVICIFDPETNTWKHIGG